MGQFVVSNAGIYFAIAEEAFAEMEDDLAKNRTPKEDGSGWIIKYDPDQKSFKNALICIVFSTLWLEAILHIKIAARYSKQEAKKQDRKSYALKLEMLGVDDPEVLSEATDFRELRRLIVHEKAFFDKGDHRTAQDEARKTWGLMRRIAQELRGDKKETS